MEWTEPPRERRRAMRVRSKGSVGIHHGARLIRGRILDLGVGGVCAELPIGFASNPGEPVRVDVKLDAWSKQFSLAGQVLRSLEATGVIAIQFRKVPSDFVDCMQEELLAAAKHDAAPQLLLVDPVAERRRVFASAFRGAGCAVTEVSTPLEAIAWVEQLRFEPGVIAIADSVPESIAEDLREFLGQQHPVAHMVAIGASGRRRDHGASWLSWVNTRDDLRLRVGRVITAHGARRRSIRSLPPARHVRGSGSRFPFSSSAER
jgi:CheY-like chemotaxis protein